MSEFTFQEAFRLDAPAQHLKVSVTHQTVDGKFLSVSFTDPERGETVFVPAEVWDMVVAAVEHRREF